MKTKLMLDEANEGLVKLRRDVGVAGKWTIKKWKAKKRRKK